MSAQNRLVFRFAGILALVAVALPAKSEPVSSSAAPDIAADYCVSFADQAAELRTRLQREELEKLKSEIDKKLLLLKERTAVLEDVLRKRNEMIELASGELLKIYSRMEVEPAARQLEKISVATAASVLRRLKPQLASQILAAMDVKRASQLVQIIAVQDSTIQQDGKP